jgi:hypothetical protein
MTFNFIGSSGEDLQYNDTLPCLIFLAGTTRIEMKYEN